MAGEIPVNIGGFLLSGTIGFIFYYLNKVIQQYAVIVTAEYIIE
ncbi:hypothetical protein AXX16_2243 [Serratia rubidaea]|nr:hypothetical protein AXX16_2243 [Serratia rubidaea]